MPHPAKLRMARIANSEPPRCPKDHVQQKMRIVLADDQRVVRDGLAALLEKQPDIEVAGRAADGQDALDQVHKLKPDVLIIDVKMPHMDGVSATRRITAEWPSIAVIGLTMYDDDIRHQAMLNAGAVECLMKTGSRENLLTAIRTAAKWKSE